MRFHEYELQLVRIGRSLIAGAGRYDGCLQKEKQQYLDFLGKQVVQLHESVAHSQTAPKPLKHQTDSPSWTRVGVKMLWEAFTDGSGPLSDLGLASLKVGWRPLRTLSSYQILWRLLIMHTRPRQQHLRPNHSNVDKVLDRDDVNGRLNVRNSALALLPLYDRRDGLTALQADLRSLGIQLGKLCENRSLGSQDHK